MPKTKTETIEHPLLMKGPLVVATLAGRKTQTRRLVTPANSTAYGWPSAKSVWPRLDWPSAQTGVMVAPGQSPVPLWRVPMTEEPSDVVLIMPRVQAVDLLWVRETWGAPYADLPGIPEGRKPAPGDKIVYRANEVDEWQWGGDVAGFCWRPSIHMPRWACRLVLPVTSVRAERVRDISEDDARAEGVTRNAWLPDGRGHREAFQDLWDKINGHRPGAAWADNPPLWVYQWEPVA